MNKRKNIIKQTVNLSIENAQRRRLASACDLLKAVLNMILGLQKYEDVKQSNKETKLSIHTYIHSIHVHETLE
jgi:hypothetical protein